MLFIHLLNNLFCLFSGRDKAKGNQHGGGPAAAQSERQGEKENPGDKLGLFSPNLSSCSDTDEEWEERKARRTAIRGKTPQTPEHQQAS